MFIQQLWENLPVILLVYLAGGWLYSLFAPKPLASDSTAHSMVKHPENSAAYKAARAQVTPTQLVVVDFFATWCGPCIRLAPFLEQLAQENPDVLIIKVQEDLCREAMAEESISAYPTIKFFVNNRCVKIIKGADEAGISASVLSLKQAAAKGDELPEAATAEGGVCAVM